MNKITSCVMLVALAMSGTRLASGKPLEQRASRPVVAMPYAHIGCQYQYSTTDFCDYRHISAYKDAILHESTNFDSKYILTSIVDYHQYHESSLVVIDPITGSVWPFPFDEYAGSLDNNGNPTTHGTLLFSKNSNTVCIKGSILVYRVLNEGTFCFTFKDGTFSGYKTQYMR